MKGKLRETLVVGDYVRSPSGSMDGVAVCRTMLEAVRLTVHRHFDRILVVVAGLEGNLRPGLKSLRRTCRDAKITLLADVDREIMVRRLVRSARNPMNVADDYVICMGDVDFFLDRGDDDVNAEIVADRTREVGEYDRIRQLERLASTDDLTGLKNRRYIREFLRQIIDRAERQDFQVTLLLFDIDNFKHYNDAYGHGVGDNVLRQAAVMTQSCCRDHDVVARIGGDEFAVVFWDKPGSSNSRGAGAEQRRIDARHPQDAYFMAERFRREISKSKLSFLGDEGRGLLTISGGLATFPVHGRNTDELFAQADRALLVAKRSGKNRVSLVSGPENR